MTNQPELDFTRPYFDGPHNEDKEPARTMRLTGQIKRVFDLMKDGRWRTLREIAEWTEDPEASISAQLRHLRKPRFGGFTVERNHIGAGLFRYRLIIDK